MKNVIRLSESDLVNMVNRVIKEVDMNAEDNSNREMKYFSKELNPKSKDYREYFHKNVMEPLKQDKTRYNLVFDILDYSSEVRKILDKDDSVNTDDVVKLMDKDLSKLEEYKDMWIKVLKDFKDEEEREIQFKINQSKPTRRMGIHNFLVDEEWGKSTGGNYWRVIKGSDGFYIEFGKTDGNKVQVRL
jgi:hypothetical protein